jgi:hypothetical protein
VPEAEDDEDMLPAEVADLFQALLEVLPPPEPKGRGNMASLYV